MIAKVSFENFKKSQLKKSTVRHIFPEIEEKTIIYVLTGRNDRVQNNENREIQLPQPKAPSKPEVVFIKYNSEIDAQRAISDIQSKFSFKFEKFLKFIFQSKSFRPIQ